MLDIILIIVLTVIFYLIIRRRREKKEKECSTVTSTCDADSVDGQSKLDKTWLLIKDNFWIIAAIVVFLALLLFSQLENKYRNVGHVTKPVPTIPCADYPPTGLKTVELKEVPDSDRTVKLILKHDNIDPQDARFFQVARFDINNDGKDDIAYTCLGYSGSCGCSWNFLLNKGDGKYEASRYSIGCTGETLEFAEETINGMRIPYFEGRKLEYEVSKPTISDAL